MGSVVKKTIKYLADIDPRTWEHPADRAALVALKKVPGLDVLLKSLIGATTEKAMKLLALASSVRASGKQFPQIFTILNQVCSRLDVRDVPELYVSYANIFKVSSAASVGVDNPFIVLNSTFIRDLSDQELATVIAHEVGHCMSGHMLYKTVLRILIMVPILGLGLPVTQIALQIIIAALLEWDRKSELSADRAGLLGVQSPEDCYTLQMKMAGGNNIAQMDINEFFIQAAEYDKGGNIIDSIFKLINLSEQTHPFPVLRLTELKMWVDNGSYAKILSGEYRRRGQAPQDEDVMSEFQRAADQYKDDIGKSKDPLAQAVSNALKNLEPMAKQVQDFFKGVFTPGGPAEDEKEKDKDKEKKD